MAVPESIAYAEQVRLDGGRLLRMLRGHAFRRLPTERAAVFFCERSGAVVERLDPGIRPCAWRRQLEEGADASQP